MHIEKNVFKNIFNTIMDVKGKTKDNIKTRLDVALFCNCKNMELVCDGSQVAKPRASFVFSVLKLGPAGRPGTVAGPGLSKKQAGNWPGQTRLTRRVDPGPSRPGQTWPRPGFIFILFLSFVLLVVSLDGYRGRRGSSRV
jgi:hypothetical protein